MEINMDSDNENIRTKQEQLEPDTENCNILFKYCRNIFKNFYIIYFNYLIIYL